MNPPMTIQPHHDDHKPTTIIQPNHDQTTIGTTLTLHHDHQLLATSQIRSQVRIPSMNMFFSDDNQSRSPACVDIGGEGSVPGRLAPAGSDPLYIPLPEGIESGEAYGFDNKYWQRHVHKPSAQRAVRKFYLTNRCKWHGQVIASSQQLAQFFDSSIVYNVQTRLQKERQWWTSRARPDERPRPPTTAKNPNDSTT